MIHLGINEPTFAESFEEWKRAEQMTVEEIRALNHRWKPAGRGWVGCQTCGALCPSDETENRSLFRKTTSGSLLITPHE